MLRSNPARRLRLSAEQQNTFDKPWQFDYSPLGIQTGSQPPNAKRFQLETQGEVFSRIRDALAMCQRKPRGLVPTCGDGFYGLYALKLGAASIRFAEIGSHRGDFRPWPFRQTEIAANLLGFDQRCTFETCDYRSLEGRYDFSILSQVLIHFPDPQEVLAKMRDIVSGPLVIFTTSVNRPEKQKFELQFPEWRAWGSSFHHDHVIKMAVDAGWTVVNESFKRMPDDWVDERNMSTFLCV